MNFLKNMSLKSLIPLLVIMLMLPFGTIIIMTSNIDTKKQLTTTTPYNVLFHWQV